MTTLNNKLINLQEITLLHFNTNLSLKILIYILSKYFRRLETLLTNHPSKTLICKNVY